MPSQEYPFRCECTVAPILAMYGINENGRLYVHVVATKNRRPISQIVSFHPVSLWCRVCERWWNIQIKNEQLTAQEQNRPPVIPRPKNNQRVLLDNPPSTQ